MSKAMRRNFMAVQDVVPSKQPWWRVTGREWPTSLPVPEIEHLLVSNRFAAVAQKAAWDKVWEQGSTPLVSIFDHVEVWESNGKVVAVTSQVYEGAAKIEAARAWAEANKLDFSSAGPEKSWHNSTPETGCHLFIFSRRD